MGGCGGVREKGREEGRDGREREKGGREGWNGRDNII